MDSKVTQFENSRLAMALEEFSRNRDDVTSLARFIHEHPHSRWNASIELNMGALRFEQGYLSDAMRYWSDSWELSRHFSDTRRKSIADEAVSKLLLLDARLGLRAEAEKRFEQIKGRRFIGTPDVRVKNARNGFWVQKQHPEIGFKCGPYAVNAILQWRSKRNATSCSQLIKNYPSTVRGTNLAQLTDLAKKVGLDMQPARRSKGAAIIIPSVMHWQIGHFAALTNKEENKYHLQDATFDSNASSWLKMAAIDAESDGYFLVPRGPLPRGWASVNRSEAQTVWGKGLSGGSGNCSGSAGSGGNGSCGCCSGPAGGPSGAGGGPAASGSGAGPPASSSDGPPNGNGPPGPAAAGPGAANDPLATPGFFYETATPTITDTPLLDNPPIGANTSIKVFYFYNQQSQPSAFTFSNIGPEWTFNWASYLSVDSSQNVTVRVRDGGYETYAYPYTPDRMSQARMVNLGGGTYQRQLNDGTVENFTLFDGTYTYLTSVVDPYGNAVTLSYDSNYRLTDINDAAGNPATTLSYLSNTPTDAGFYKIASATDGFGRSCVFGYDSTKTLLTSVTDAVQNVSQFSYDASSSFITLLTTPYGTTSFYQYVPQGYTPGYPPVGLRTTYPDGTASVIENWIYEPKLTHVWDRNMLSRYPNDPVNHVYSHCQTMRWLMDAATSLESPVPNWTRMPLESPVIYSYPGEQNQDYVGSSNNPTQICRSLHPTRTLATIGGTITLGTTVGLNFSDSLFPNATATYSIQSGDNLTSIAAGLAAAVNSDPILQSFGISATSSSTIVTVYNPSTNPTKITPSSTGYQTVTLGTDPNASCSANLTGTATFGDTITITVNNSGLSGGYHSVSYIVRAADNLGTVAQGLASVLNSDSALQSIGISAVWTVPALSMPTLTLLSDSSNATTYSSSVNTGATESITLTPNPNGIITIAGTATGGDVLEVVINDTNLSGGGTKSEFYTVQPTDGLGDIAHGFANIINSDSALSAIGITAGWAPDGTLAIQSTSNGGTNYVAVPPASSATEQLTAATTAQQAWTYVRNRWGFVVQAKDPVGRRFSYSYASNDIDLLSVSETKGSNNYALASWTYGSAPHLPLTHTNGSGQTTVLTYNSLGELATRTDANGNSSTLSYDSAGYLEKIEGPLPGGQDVIQFTWFGYGNVKTVTNSEGYTLTYAYDAVNRPISATFPDGSSATTVYDRLDAVLQSDRLGRWTRHNFDSMDQLVQTVDPLGRRTSFCWCSCGSLTSMTDANGYTTSWHHDLQGRVTSKVFADSTSAQFTYEASTSRLQSSTDALNQTNSFRYNLDDTLATRNYANSVNSTSPVMLEYDLNYSRLSSLSNGWGGYAYQYNPYTTSGTSKAFLFIGGYPQTPSGADTINLTFNNAALSGGTYSMPTYSVSTSDAGNTSAVAAHLVSTINANLTLSTAGISATADGSLVTVDAVGAVTVLPTTSGNTTATVGGGGQLAQISNNVIPNSVITYSYDSLSRPSVRTVNGGNNSTNWAYDAISRVTAETNPLGGSTPFSYTYVNDTSGSSKGDPRLQSITYPNLQKTNFNYYPTTFDERLQSIQNILPNSNALSQFTLAYDAAGELTNWHQQQLNTHLNQSINYDLAGQLRSVKSATGAIAQPYLTQHHFNYDRGGNRTSVQKSAGQLATVGGAVTTGDTITITVKDAALTGGQESVGPYTVSSSDTTSTIAANLAALITSDSALQATSINATPKGSIIQFKSRSGNATTYSAIIGGSATEQLIFGANTLTENITVGGTLTNGDVVSISVYDPALSTNPTTVSHTVNTGTDTINSIAADLASKLQLNLTAISCTVSSTPTPFSSIGVISSTTLSPNVTRYTQTVSGSATERISMSPSLNGTSIAVISGSATLNDQLQVVVSDNGLSSGPETVAHTVTSGESISAMAAGIASAINADNNLQQIGVTATSSGGVVSITSASTNATTYAAYSKNSGGTSFGTESIFLPAPVNGIETATVGGSVSVNDVVNIAIYDPSISGGTETFSHTVVSTDTKNSIAVDLASQINTALSSIGITGSVPNGTTGVINMTSNTTNSTFYSGYISGTGSLTDTITLPPATFTNTASYNQLNQLTGIAAGGPVAFQANSVRQLASATINVNQTVTVNVTSITPGNAALIMVNDNGLSQAEPVSYTVQTGDTASSIAASLAYNVNHDSVLSTIGVTASSTGAAVTLTSSSTNPTTYTVAVSSGATISLASGASRGEATYINPLTEFTTSPSLAAGNNVATITAVSGGGSGSATSIPIATSGPTSQSFSYDANGNVTGDGTNTYAYDAENRLIKITYPGANNYSQFQYDGLGRCVAITEVTGGTTSSIKQFVWCGNSRCETRDGSGNLLAQYFSRGQVNYSGSTGTSYYFTLDHLGSVREMTNSSAAIVYQQSFDAYGNPTYIAGSGSAPDFGFAGMYVHQRSGLNLTMFRAYSPTLGRWLTRDPSREFGGGGLNLYAYCFNDPINLIDCFGDKPGDPFTSAQSAARDALKWINPKSKTTNQEYAGLIYKDAQGNYKATMPSSGSVAGSSIGSCPAGGSQVGDYHTHGNYSDVQGHIVSRANDAYDSEHFSQQDIRSDKFWNSTIPGYKGWLSTPSDAFWVDDPSSGKQTNLGHL